MVALPSKSRQGAGFRASFVLSVLLAATAHAHPYEPDPVQFALDELGVKYPGEPVQYRRPTVDEPDDAPDEYRTDVHEVETYASWLEMLTRRAIAAADTRPERHWAGHARDSLAEARRWLKDGKKQEGDRGAIPPYDNPITVAHRIAPLKRDRTPRSISCYQIALSHLHDGARYALAVLKAHGIDPTREPIESERPEPNSRIGKAGRIEPR